MMTVETEEHAAAVEALSQNATEEIDLGSVSRCRSEMFIADNQLYLSVRGPLLTFYVEKGDWN